jgi:hypothetical protein
MRWSALTVVREEERVKLGEVTIDTSRRSKIIFSLERTPDSYCDRRWRDRLGPTALAGR